MTTQAISEARLAYDAMAPDYDAFSHRYMYERWTARLLACAERAGLAGSSVLDVGCGTGLSLVVPLRRGMSVTGCDISPGMLAQARARLGDRATLVEADMRALPAIGSFDLIWSVSDALNYLLEPAELRQALEGMRHNLAPEGLVVFDLNTLAGYRASWVADSSFAKEGRRFGWCCETREVVPGGIFAATLRGDGMATSRHRQRHFPEAEVRAALEAAGLEAVEVYGETDGALEPGLDEGHHTKAAYVARGRRFATMRPRHVEALELRPG